MHTTSFSLIERLRRPGEQDAWDRLVELYTPLLYYWAHRMGLKAEDAADLVQEVFAILVKKLPDFLYDKHKSFRGWLRTILHNRWRDSLRRAARSEEHGSSALADEQEAKPIEPFWEAEYREHLVGRALELMRSEFQTTTWQACWETVVSDKPAAQVAKELGITLDAVYAAKSRVLRRLRQELEGLLE